MGSISLLLRHNCCANSDSGRSPCMFRENAFVQDCWIPILSSPQGVRPGMYTACFVPDTASTLPPVLLARGALSGVDGLLLLHRLLRR